MPILISKEDFAHLDKLEPKLELIRTRVKGVCEHLHTGLYLWGEGGTSKSYTVDEALKANQANYRLHNSRMTGRGLFDTLHDDPTAIHVLEDVESMFGDKMAWGVLRSALWSQSRKRPKERPVTWTAHRTRLEFTFTGGIIIVANRGLEDLPELQALKTRIPIIRFNATDEEIAALMRVTAMDGFSYGEDALNAFEAMKVVDWLIERAKEAHRPPNMRLMNLGFKDFIQWKTGKSKTHWEDLLHNLIRRDTSTYKTRAQRSAEETAIAQEIMAMAVPVKEKERLYKERTGKSLRAMYRRLRG